MLAAQARAQTEQAIAAHKAQIARQQAQNAAIHPQAKAQTEVELAKLKANLDAPMAMLDAHKPQSKRGRCLTLQYRAHAKPGTATITCPIPSDPENS